MEVNFKRRSNGLSSTWVRLLSFLLVMNWSLFSGLASVSVDLGWKPSPSPDVVAYKLYVGNSSGNYSSVITVSSVTNTTLSQLQENTTYVVAVTALNSANLESVPTPETSFTTPALQNSAPAISMSVSPVSSSYIYGQVITFSGT